MSTLQIKPPADTQRPYRNWIAETLVVAGILAFGYFAIMLETSQPWSTNRLASDAPQELLP